MTTYDPQNVLDKVDFVSMPEYICEKLYVTWDYNFYIFINFFLIMTLFFNHYYNFSPKYLDKDVDKFNGLIITTLAVFNTCMILFQFIVKPLEVLLLG